MEPTRRVQHPAMKGGSLLRGPIGAERRDCFSSRSTVSQGIGFEGLWNVCRELPQGGKDAERGTALSVPAVSGTDHLHEVRRRADFFDWRRPRLHRQTSRGTYA